MNIAYNAGLQAATAALAAAGYRASRDQHHYRIIPSLRETIGASAQLVATVDAFRKKRNITGYEQWAPCQTLMPSRCASWLSRYGTKS